ncbi:MAG: hypothetical protein QJR08_06640 [Bacillota bacterium]|nr:hypothetical protein [Bacillota bacterium]
MRLWLAEWRALRSGMFAIMAVYGGLLVTYLLLAPRPPSVALYNEVAMAPLAVMAVGVLFHRDLAGNQMELFASYPLSLAAMIVRKWASALGLVLAFHLLWSRVYLWRFREIVAPLYSWSGRAWAWKPASELSLLALALPEYMAVAGLTLLVTIVAKRVDVGLLAGFALFLLESLNAGSGASGAGALFTMNLPAQALLPNRILWTGAGLAALALAALWTERRTRWIEEGGE